VWKWILGAVALVAAVLVIRSIFEGQDAQWQARVDREVDRAVISLAETAIAVLRSDSLEAVADSLALEAGRRDTVIQKMIVELPAPPPECEPFTLPRDIVIKNLGKQNRLVSTAFLRQREAAAQLRIAEAGARRSADSLLAVLGDRPRPISPLIPQVGLGATAGICTTGQPCVAIGLTLSWKVKL
jgi:hypothetical protein